jgi:acetyl-CoA C-acetyltransferase
MTHSLAAMAETLRADPGSFGLTSGVGMHMQKHSYGVWSTAPGARAPGPTTATVPGSGPSRIVEAPEGRAIVATYSVLHGRDGTPASALLVCDLPEGGRCYARLDGGPDVLARAESVELIGRGVTLTPQDGINVARPA